MNSDLLTMVGNVDFLIVVSVYLLVRLEGKIDIIFKEKRMDKYELEHFPRDKSAKSSKRSRKWL